MLKAAQNKWGYSTDAHRPRSRLRWLAAEMPSAAPGEGAGGATFSAGLPMLAAKQTPNVIFRFLSFFVKAKVLFGFLLADKQVLM